METSIITIFLALLIFIVGYAVSKFLLKKVEAIAEVADILALAIGVVCAFIFVGYFK